MSSPFKDCSSFCKDSCHDQASTSSTPFVSAPSSPRHGAHPPPSSSSSSFCASPSEFDFSARLFDSALASPWLTPSADAASAMSSADELFHNGKIKPLNSRFSDFVCCIDALHSCYDPMPPLLDVHTYDPSCPQCAACKGSSLSPSSEHGASPTQPSTWERQAKLACPSEDTLEQWRRGAGRMDHDRGNARYARMRVTQLSGLPLASYSKSGDGVRHHRRARSLSPLRVFHMDDMVQPRASFESELYIHMTSHPGDPDVGCSTKTSRRRSRKSWTLRELLNLGDNKVHDRRPRAAGKFGGHAGLDTAKFRGRVHQGRTGKRADMEHAHNKGASTAADDNRHSKSPLTQHATEAGIGASSPLKPETANVSRHAEHHRREAHAEASSKHSFLPGYKKGLLGCLGFTSKLNSVKDLHAVQFNAG